MSILQGRVGMGMKVGVLDCILYELHSPTNLGCLVESNIFVVAMSSTQLTSKETTSQSGIHYSTKAENNVLK